MSNIDQRVIDKIMPNLENIVRIKWKGSLWYITKSFCIEQHLSHILISTENKIPRQNYNRTTWKYATIKNQQRASSTCKSVGNTDCRYIRSWNKSFWHNSYYLKYAPFMSVNYLEHAPFLFCLLWNLSRRNFYRLHSQFHCFTPAYIILLQARKTRNALVFVIIMISFGLLLFYKTPEDQDSGDSGSSRHRPSDEFAHLIPSSKQIKLLLALSLSCNSSIVFVVAPLVRWTNWIRGGSIWSRSNQRHTTGKETFWLWAPGFLNVNNICRFLLFLIQLQG